MLDSMANLLECRNRLFKKLSTRVSNAYPKPTTRKKSYASSIFEIPSRPAHAGRLDIKCVSCTANTQMFSGC